MQEWATIVAKDTQNRPAVVHLLGSSYTWAGQRNGKILEELVSEHVYGPESQKILTAMRDGAVREMLRIAEEMTPTEVWDVIDDALAAATYRPDTTH
ncbi:hypothetical protein SAMN05421803_1498 [Nocardiopsis flavescens]|uniref:Uncharacterized protein n=2 Tax=Nocardiopsis flavescens TaxID=758803 RepID=A0A1M6WR28_9ACTN|nr:hypothetical protein SAMN05421803_1498 [Nocardiopsis flavescens]